MQTTSLSELFPSTAPVQTAANRPDELGQDDFMTLMVAQLQNQDPTKPMDNMQFLAQIAQFGTVSGIQELQGSFSGLSSALYASQALQASNLVGRDVVTQSNMGALSAEGGIDATVDLPQSTTQLTLYVQNEAGLLVHSQALGGAAAGEVKVQWDGTDENGTRLPAGNYRISAEAWLDGQNQAASVYTHNRVESVTVNQTTGGAILNLAGGAQVGTDEVRSFL